MHFICNDSYTNTNYTSQQHVMVPLVAGKLLVIKRLILL